MHNSGQKPDSPIYKGLVKPDSAKMSENMAGECREALLKRNSYYENCPGCKVDQLKELKKGIPFREIASIWIIRDFGIAKREEDIGYYAGYVGELDFQVIFNGLFGLSVNFWMAIITRFLLGSLNGILGPLKAYAVEIFREEHQALGLSTVNTAWGIGLIIGPGLGGFLVQETLHKHDEKKISSIDSYGVVEAANGTNRIISEGDEIRADDEERKQTSMASLLKNWPFMSSIIVYSVFSLHDMAYSEIFSLWAESSRKLGGLGYTAGDVGVVLSISGPVHTPIGKLSFYSYVVRAPSQLMSITTSLIILQNNAVDQKQRGAANGIAMTAVSLFRGIGPAGGGALLSWAQKRQKAAFLPGMIFDDFCFPINQPDLLIS
ncbi:unnamed protein product [Dovyalis caffra]|uniref:Major facilitator superfamily (MFS) profile domain-containing protein n=1 Tax=Dovyalis caffra TaxID=77055 RepID=A0AAV1QU24_9ROSI|nr:unnamed protein product [Dovyalis caffra]